MQIILNEDDEVTIRKALGDIQGPVLHVTTLIYQLSAWVNFYLSISTSSKRCAFMYPSNKHVVNDMPNG